MPRRLEGTGPAKRSDPTPDTENSNESSVCGEAGNRKSLDGVDPARRYRDEAALPFLGVVAVRVGRGRRRAAVRRRHD